MGGRTGGGRERGGGKGDVRTCERRRCISAFIRVNMRTMSSNMQPTLSESSVSRSTSSLVCRERARERERARARVVSSAMSNIQ